MSKNRGRIKKALDDLAATAAPTTPMMAAVVKTASAITEADVRMVRERADELYAKAPWLGYGVTEQADRWNDLADRLDCIREEGEE